MDLLALLAPLGAIDRRVKSRLGDFTPVGVILHHTASRIGQDPAPSLTIVREGRSDLPGPLCNVLVARDAHIYLITDGRANDSGGGDPDVLAAVKAGAPLPKPNDTSTTRVDGNRWFYDIEVENDGLGEPYSDRVLESTARVAAALLKAHGWGVERLLRHKDWTTRKIDWSWSGDYRALTARHLTPQPPEDDESMAVIIKHHAGSRFELTDWLTKRGIPSNAVLNELQAKGVRVVEVSDALADSIPLAR